MIVALGHIQQFVQDHPRYFSIGESIKITEYAKELVETGFGVVFLDSRDVCMLMPDHLDEFVGLIGTSETYLKISQDACSALLK